MTRITTIMYDFYLCWYSVLKKTQTFLINALYIVLGLLNWLL